MSFAAWLSVAIICMLGAMTPGPSLAVVMRYSVGHSRQAGFACALAHGLGIGFYAVITMTGLGVLFQTIPAFHNAVSILGALYLIWLAIRAWRAAASGAKFDANGAGKVSGSVLQAARDGFMIAFLNPKIALFFLALFSQFISPEFEWSGKFLLAFTAAAIDALWYCLAAIGLSHGAVLPWLREHSAWIERCIAILFVLIALRVVWGLVAT